jgi:hypothetical protein
MGTSYNPKIVTNGLVLNLDPANVKSYPANQDPYVNNVSLMLDGESLTDKSQNSVTVTVQGTVTVDSSVKKVGNSSLKFAGALTDYLTVPSSSLFAFPGDFTVEFWTYANQWGQRSGATIYFCNGTLNQFQLGAYPSATQINLYFNGSSFITASLSASVVGRWMHIALVRSGSTITIYENGTAVGSGTSSYSVPASICYIGRQLPRSPTDYGHNLDGYIDDLRVTKSARYTASFTPPAAPLSLPGRLTDLTKNRVVGTLTNGPTYSGGNLVFNGTNHYITSPTSTLFNFGTGDFTIEMWVYPTSVKTFSLLDFRINETNPNGNAFVIGTSASNLWVVYQAGNQITGPTVVANQWVQVVVNRVGTAVKMFLNGVQIGSTWTTSNTFTDGAFVLGTDYPLNARFFQGNVSSVKVYKAKGFTNNEILQNFNATKGRFGL